MTKLSDLPEDLVAEILSRVPTSSLFPVRSTCKLWNGLSKKLVLGQNAASRKNNPFREFTVFYSKLCSLKFNLQGIRNEEEEIIDLTPEHVSIFNEINVNHVFYCDGLLLCVTKEDSPRVMVWNPYLGQIRWIKPVNKFYIRESQDGFVLGFDDKGNRKILGFDVQRGRRINVYEFSSDSWRVLDIRPDYENLCFRTGVSLKGNVYFIHQDRTEEPRTIELIGTVDSLVCFDFTIERFGPRLRLPFNPPYPSFDTLTLSSVRDDKLSVMHQHSAFDKMEIWVSTKIEPNAISWSKFLSVDLTLISGFLGDFRARIFFTNEDKKVAVVVSQAHFSPPSKTRACIIGEDGYFKSVNIREGENRSNDCLQHACSSYVPSLVQL